MPRLRYAPHLHPENRAARLASKLVASHIAASQLATYRAAQTDRSTADWPTTNYSADGALLPDLGHLTARHRAAGRDDWQAKSIKLAYQRHIQGTGITARAVARNPDDPEKALDAFNREVDDAWREFVEDPKLCDLLGQQMLPGLLDVQIGDMVEAGNGFLTPRIVHPNAGGGARRDQVGLVLQAFEVEQLATEFDTIRGLTPAGSAGREIRNGVELDQFGRPIHYLVHLREHPLELWSTLREPTRIPADEVLHLRRPTRTRETLSPPILTPALARIWRNESYEIDEAFAKRLEATIGFAVQMDPRYGDPSAAIGQPGMPGLPANWGAGAGERGEGRARAIDLSGGQIPVLFPGEEIKMYNPQRPGTMYDKYMRTQIGMNAAGAGLDYATISRDFSTSSYGSLRQGMLELWREVDPYQVRLIGTILRPIRTLFIELGILQGLFDAPQYWTDARWRRAYRKTLWMPPKRDWIDPAKEAAAIKIMLDYYLTSRPQEWTRQGVYALDMLQEIKETRDQAADWGITFPEDAMVESQLAGAAPGSGGGGGRGNTSPSEPKVHGAGDSRKRRGRAKSGDTPRTQSAPRGQHRAILASLSRRQRQRLVREATDRLVGDILAQAMQED